MWILQWEVTRGASVREKMGRENQKRLSGVIGDCGFLDLPNLLHIYVLMESCFNKMPLECGTHF